LQKAPAPKNVGVRCAAVEFCLAPAFSLVNQQGITMNKAFAIFLLAIIAGLFNTAAAVDLRICADTVAEIEQGIVAASNPNLPEDRVVVAVVQGDYDLTNSLVLANVNQSRVLRRTLFLLGGYSSGTCNVRTLQPTNTVLRNTSALRRLSFQQAADVTITGFHWLNFEGQIEVSNSDADTSQQDLEFSYNRITGGRGNVELRVATDGPTSSIYVRNNIIAARAAGGDSTTLALIGDGGASGTVRALLSNNTIALNGMPQTIFMGSLELVNLSNNIVSLNNNSFDLFANAVGIIDAYHNQFATTNAIAFTNNVNNSPANPTFVNGLGLDLRLQTGSVGINTGLNTPLLSPGATDVANLTRRVGTIDRGAHESNVGEGGEIVVSNTNDSGNGSLRAAIVLANSTVGVNRIVFAIPGVTCPKVITLQSALPSILSSMSIEGSTQVGYVPNTSSTSDNGTRCIAIVPGNTGIVNGIEVPSSAQSLRLQIDGLAIGGFAGAGIALSGGRAHRIVGSQFGGSIGATSLAGGLIGISVSANDVEIGDDDPAERNSLGGYNSTGFLSGTAIVLDSTTQNARIVNNFIGMRPNGGALANTIGVNIQGDQNYLQDNVVSYHTELAVRIGSSANNNTLSRNRFGLPPLCLFGSCSSAGNRQAVVIEGLANELNSNTIANSDLAAVRVTNDFNPLLRNLIYDGAQNVPAIDIASAGFTSNDNDSGVSLPAGNRGQNYPVLNAVRGGPGGTVLASGRLTSANGEYVVQFFTANRFLNLSLRCEARRYLNSIVVVINNGTASNDGFVDFSRVLPASNDSFLTATATRLEQNGTETRYRDTSEIGNCYENPLLIDGFESLPE
jgi:hypothetical protein